MICCALLTLGKFALSQNIREQSWREHSRAKLIAFSRLQQVIGASCPNTTVRSAFLRDESICVASQLKQFALVVTLWQRWVTWSIIVCYTNSLAPSIGDLTLIEWQQASQPGLVHPDMAIFEQYRILIICTSYNHEIITENYCSTNRRQHIHPR